eukprot:TRINITY_DN26621_c0_g1_i2.p1 TRINITY_DN26621_c0_g1~~TRINITY_DN26621_c0_g1_i2.p1  ORF type:complete len:510 (+),score=86.82 TRINITY_DN26621_c0_g1_i2:172-1530(+)
MATVYHGGGGGSRSRERRPCSPAAAPNDSRAAAGGLRTAAPTERAEPVGGAPAAPSARAAPAEAAAPRADLAHYAARAEELTGSNAVRYADVPCKFGQGPTFSLARPSRSAQGDALYAPWLHALWAKLLGQNGCDRGGLFIDAGANIAYFSHQAACLGCSVASVEVNRRQLPYIAAAAQRNVKKGHTALELWPVALGNFTPGSVLTSSENVVGSDIALVDGMATAVVVNSTVAMRDPNQVVPALRLDELVRQYPEQGGVWMKMDVVGQELGALRSATALLSSGRLKGLAVEVKQDRRAVREFMNQYGYDCVGWIEAYGLESLAKHEAILRHPSDEQLFFHLLPCSCMFGGSRRRLMEHQIIRANMVEEFFYVRPPPGSDVRRHLAGMFGFTFPGQLRNKCQWWCVHCPETSTGVRHERVLSQHTTIKDGVAVVTRKMRKPSGNVGRQKLRVR